MLKKIILIAGIIFITIILLISKENAILVYNEIEDNNNYQPIYLLFENNTLNTNNFEQILNDFKVLKVYPYINPVYSDKLKYNYSFTYETHDYDLEKFKQNYIVKLRNIGLINEANQIQVNGIIIEKVLVLSTIDELTKKLKDFNYIKYSLNITENYKKLLKN